MDMNNIIPPAHIVTKNELSKKGKEEVNVMKGTLTMGKMPLGDFLRTRNGIKLNFCGE